jgi:hypothetical protein
MCVEGSAWRGRGGWFVLVMRGKVSIGVIGGLVCAEGIEYVVQGPMCSKIGHGWHSRSA